MSVSFLLPITWRKIGLGKGKAGDKATDLKLQAMSILNGLFFLLLAVIFSNAPYVSNLYITTLIVVVLVKGTCPEQESSLW